MSARPYPILAVDPRKEKQKKKKKREQPRCAYRECAEEKRRRSTGSRVSRSLNRDAEEKSRAREKGLPRFRAQEPLGGGGSAIVSQGLGREANGEGRTVAGRFPGCIARGRGNLSALRRGRSPPLSNPRQYRSMPNGSPAIAVDASELCTPAMITRTAVPAFVCLRSRASVPVFVRGYTSTRSEF